MALTRAGQHPVNNILTQMAWEGMGQEFLVDAGVLPQINVPEISGTWIADDPKGYAGAAQVSLGRAPGAGRATAEVNDPLSGTFNCRDHAFELPIDLRLDIITNQLADLPVSRAAQAARIVKLAMEQRLRDMLFTGAWTTTFASTAGLVTGTQWGDVIGGFDPMADLNTLCHTTFPEGAWGEKANTMVMSNDIAVFLNNDASIRGYLASSVGNIGVGSRTISAANNFALLRGIIGEVCGIDPNRIFVGSYIENTANTAQTGVQARVWSDAFWIGKVDLGGAKSSDGANRVFLQPTAAVDFQAHPFAAGSWTSQNRLTQWQFAEQANDYNLTNAGLGISIADALA